MIGIYLIQNKLNGHCYVGQSVDIHRRWRQHREAAKNNEYAPLYLTMRKYGIENFDFSILEECEIEELDNKEIQYIEQFNSYSQGYNQTRGGSQYSHNVRLTDEDLERIIELLLNSNKTQREIAKQFEVGEDTISEINTGKSRHQAGLHYPLRENKKTTCIDCGAKIYYNATRCEKCSQIARRKVERPTKEQLYQDLVDTNFSAVGRKYGVSDNAVRKWCKEYGLPTKAADYKRKKP